MDNFEEKDRVAPETVKDEHPSFVDQYGNIYNIGEELARGGQGVVYRTTDPDLAIKQPLDSEGQPDKNSNLSDRFQSIRCLPLPQNIPLTFPLAILRDAPGYVMRLLNGMKPLGKFEFDGKAEKETENQEIPQWLSGIEDKKMAHCLAYYAETGSSKQRYLGLYKCAAILARLHLAGLVYGDISLNNVFMNFDGKNDVWLIDADNLRYERVNGGGGTYTPGLGAPEIIKGLDSSRPCTDCWAFSVMAFKLLSLNHPFIGKKITDAEDDEGGWDDDTVASGDSGDLEERAYAGEFPFIDDEEDDSNTCENGLPRELVLTPELKKLFQETLGYGRKTPMRRSTMTLWTLEFAKAYDHSIFCPTCGMSYFPEKFNSCPYCDASRPMCVKVQTKRWYKIVSVPPENSLVSFPHRMFHPFSLRLGDVPEYNGCWDQENKQIIPERGTIFPEDFIQTFLED